MTEMKIEQETLKAFLGAIQALVTECRVRFTENGMETLAVDTANAAMVHATLPKEAMETYASPDCTIGFDLEKFEKAMSVMPGGTLTLQVDPARVVISDGKSTTYCVTNIDTTTIRKEPNIPKLELHAVATLGGPDLAEAFKNMAKIGDKVTLEQKEKLLTLTTEGETDQLVREIDVERENLSQAVSTFSLDYLQDMGKILKPADKVTVRIAVDHPVKFEFELPAGVKVEYLLAPRIENPE